MPARILLVDDSATMRMIVKKALRLSGVEAELTEAGDGAEALQALESGGAVDLILSDINMPNVNGIEFVRRLKAGPYSGIPVVMITTEGAEARINELQEMGVQGYIKKPFTPESIRETVVPLLGG